MTMEIKNDLKLNEGDVEIICRALKEAIQSKENMLLSVKDDPYPYYLNEASIKCIESDLSKLKGTFQKVLKQQTVTLINCG